MSSDLRSAGRAVVSFPLELRHRESPAVRCRACNISVEGMLLQTDEVRLTVGTRVELNIEIEQRVWQVAAVVLHNYGHTMGVMFQQRQPDLYRVVTTHAKI